MVSGQQGRTDAEGCDTTMAGGTSPKDYMQQIQTHGHGGCVGRASAVEGAAKQAGPTG